MFLGPLLAADERRVAHDERLRRGGREDDAPVDVQRVAAAEDVRLLLQREVRLHVDAQQLFQLAVHLLLHEDDRGPGDARGPRVDLDAVELRQLDDRARTHAPGDRGEPGDDAVLDAAQLPIGDDQEVAGAARRVEVVGLGERGLEVVEGAAVVPRRQHLLLDGVEEQRPQHLEDVRLGRVVRAEFAAGLLRLDLLEHGPEHHRVDLRPVVGSHPHELVAHLVGEVRDRVAAAEQPSVHVGERLEARINADRPIGFRLVERLEKQGEKRAERERRGRRAVWPHEQAFEQALGTFAAPDSGVVAEVQEQYAHQQGLRGLFVVTSVHQGPVQVGHELGGLRIDPGFLAGEVLHPALEDLAEPLDVVGQVRERELDPLVGEHVHESDAREVADDDDRRNHCLGQDVVARLVLGIIEVRPGGLVLDQGDLGPQSIDPAMLAGRTAFRRMLPGQVHVRFGDPADAGEEVSPELLVVLLFAGDADPSLSERRGGVA